MPEITVIHIALLAGALIIGVVVGWVFRGNKSSSEKAAINLGWQEQLEAQRQEHERLLDQNKSLMEQNSQYQASNTDSKMRASELSGALKEAFERRDELQRQIKDIRSHLESTVEERDQLASEVQSRTSSEGSSSNLLRIRDEQIATLSKEL
jgi:chromosome segregation ATPase